MKISYTQQWLSVYITYVILLVPHQTYANELSGNIVIEVRYFNQDARYVGQDNGNVSLSLQPEFQHRWDNDDYLLVELQRFF